MVLEEYSYTSTPFWATTGPVMRLLYFFLQFFTFFNTLLTLFMLDLRYSLETHLCTD